MAQPFAEEVGKVPMSRGLGEALQRAYALAREQGAPTVSLEHGLLALTDDPEAIGVLQACNIDLNRLRADVSGHLATWIAQRGGASPSNPQPDAELLRVLQGAGLAARQSPRKMVDGAIVLAAVVGDGKTAAAGVLRAHGLTFDEAIKILRRVAAAQSAPPPAAVRQPPPAPLPPPAQQPQPAAVRPPPPAAAPAQIHGELPPQQAPVSHPTATPSPPPQLAPSAATPPTPSEVLAAVRARLSLQDPPPAPAQPPAAPPPLPAASAAAAAAAAVAVVSEPAKSGAAPPEPPAPAGPVAAIDAPAPDRAPEPPVRPAAQAPRLVPSPVAAAAAAGPALNKAPLPFPVRPVAPGDGPARPALPGQTALETPPPPLAPWPEAADRLPPPSPPSPLSMPVPEAGNFAGAPYPEYDSYAGHPAPSLAEGAQPRPAIHLDTQRLVENFPDALWIGEPQIIELALPREVLEALALSPESRISLPFATRAVAIRLRPHGVGCHVDALSNETQWVEYSRGPVPDDMIVWRWAVTGRRRGPASLQLQIAARTIGHDGAPLDAQLPDQAFELHGRERTGKRLRRYLGWLALLVLGAVTGIAVSGVVRAIFPAWTHLLGG